MRDIPGEDPPPDSYGPESDGLQCAVRGCEHEDEDLVATPNGPMCEPHAEAFLEAERDG